MKNLMLVFVILFTNLPMCFSSSTKDMIPLHKAISSGQLDRVQACINSENFAYEETDDQGNSAMHLAAGMENEDILIFLIENGFPSSYVNAQGETPLLIAAKKGYRSNTMALYLQRSPINTQCNSGHTALSWMAYHDCYDITLRLVLSGSNPNLMAKNGQSPLSRAIAVMNLDIVQKLLQYGAQIRSSDFEIETSKDISDCLKSTYYARSLTMHSKL